MSAFSCKKGVNLLIFLPKLPCTWRGGAAVSGYSSIVQSATYWIYSGCSVAALSVVKSQPVCFMPVEIFEIFVSLHGPTRKEKKLP